MLNYLFIIWILY